jgi:hypothetical protein
VLGLCWVTIICDVPVGVFRMLCAVYFPRGTLHLRGEEKKLFGSAERKTRQDKATNARAKGSAQI